MIAFSFDVRFGRILELNYIFVVIYGIIIFLNIQCV